MTPWEAKKVRYIKLGQNHRWWAECKKNQTIRVGFDTGLAPVHSMAKSGSWDDIRAYWESRTGTPTAHMNQTRQFFEDSGDTLWVTFEEGCLYWAISDGTLPTPLPAEDGCEASSCRQLLGDGWCNKDANGLELRMEGLSGKLTKTAAYRQTICGFDEDTEIYLRARLAGKVSEEVEEAEAAKSGLEEKIEKLVKTLTWWDFELLIELIFSQSGWRRTTPTGGNQRITDMDLMNPVTKDRCFVQVKSRADQAQLNRYVLLKEQERRSFNRMYFVYHTGRLDQSELDGTVTVWNVHQVASQVVANGLIDWVIEKSK